MNRDRMSAGKLMPAEKDSRNGELCRQPRLQHCLNETERAWLDRLGLVLIVFGVQGERHLVASPNFATVLIVFSKG